MEKKQAIKRGRKPLPEGEKKITIPIFVEQKYVDALGIDGCRDAADYEIRRQYDMAKELKEEPPAAPVPPVPPKADPFAHLDDEVMGQDGYTDKERAERKAKIRAGNI